MSEQAIKYINPWKEDMHNAHGFEEKTYNPADITHRTKCGRGFIVRTVGRAGLYFVDGVAVTERAGRSKENIERITGHLLGRSPSRFSVDESAKETFFKMRSLTHTANR